MVNKLIPCSIFLPGSSRLVARLVGLQQLRAHCGGQDKQGYSSVMVYLDDLLGEVT